MSVLCQIVDLEKKNLLLPGSGFEASRPKLKELEVEA